MVRKKSPKSDLDQELEELLADPIVLMAMEADGVNAVELAQLLQESRARLGASSLGARPRRPITYRYGVGLALFNAEGLVFVARRLGQSDGTWQMPQGGIEQGEHPEDAALRELAEEIGTAKATILQQSDAWYRYELPEKFRAIALHKGFDGQIQKWFALRFTGSDRDIQLDTGEPEFEAWRWVPGCEVASLASPFRRPVYRAVMADFAHLALPGPQDGPL